VIARADAPGGQAIQVHGGWTVEVRNPDGSLADQRSFTNDLTSSGANALAGILAGNYTINRWQIAASPGICSDNSGIETLCGVAENDDPIVATQNEFYGGLTVTGPEDAFDPGVLVLNGSFIVQNDGQIDRVTTFLDQLNPFAVTFTFALIDPIPVTTGQQVVISVDISFSKNSNVFAGILARNYTIASRWLYVTGVEPLCVDDDGDPGVCLIATSLGTSGSLDPATTFDTLVVSGPTDFSDDTKFAFSGTLTAERDGDVLSLLPQIRVTIPNGTGIVTFLDTTNLTPVPVVAGQDVEVRVEFPFQ
jgi:hypothetical protein